MAGPIRVSCGPTMALGRSNADAEGGHAQDGHERGAISPCGRLERAAAGAQLVVIELGGRGGRASDKVGDAKAGSKQLGTIPRGQHAVREAGGFEGPPEAVARSSEVLAGGAGVEAGVDAAEQDAQARGDQVRDDGVLRRHELLARRPPGSIEVTGHGVECAVWCGLVGSTGRRSMGPEVLQTGWRDHDPGGLTRLAMAHDEAGVGGVLPHGQARAGRPPGLHGLGVRPGVRADPLEEVEDQVVDGLGHRW